MAVRSCTPVPSRRALFGAAIALPVLVAAPALAGSHLHHAGASPDAGLLAHAAEWAALHDEWAQLDLEHDRLFDAYTEALPTAPAALVVTRSDAALFGYGAAEVGGVFDKARIAELGRLIPRWLARNIGASPGQAVNDPAAVRAAAVLEANAQWLRDLDAPEHRSRKLAMAPLAERIGQIADRTGELEDLILATPAHTPQGLAAKARVWSPTPAPGEDDEPEHYSVAVLRSLHADLQRLGA